MLFAASGEATNVRGTRERKDNVYATRSLGTKATSPGPRGLKSLFDELAELRRGGSPQYANVRGDPEDQALNAFSQSDSEGDTEVTVETEFSIFADSRWGMDSMGMGGSGGMGMDSGSDSMGMGTMEGELIQGSLFRLPIMWKKSFESQLT